MTIKSPRQIETMAEGGRILADVLSRLAQAALPGVEGHSLDARAEAWIRDAGARPAFKGYRSHHRDTPFPATLCLSINETVVHGIPTAAPLRKGDIVKFDLGLIYKGYYLDAAITVGVDGVSKEARKLMAATQEALAAGIKELQPGKTLGDVGHAIEAVAKKYRVAVAHGLTGHGIGKNLHEDPVVFNVGNPGEGLELREGMVLAIEPMFVLGKGKLRENTDGEFATADKSLSAHFEHTIAVTAKGPRILTVC